MTGCYGNHPEDRARERELNDYLDKTYGKPEKRQQDIDDLARDKFMALPDFYTSRDGTKRWTNIDDASGSLTQGEWIAIGRALRDGDNFLAGQLLSDALIRVLTNDAENEIDDRE